MTFKKFAFIPVIVGVLALFIQVVDQLLAPSVLPVGNSGFGWIAFQSWALYFLAGCSVQGGIKVLLSYIAGIAGSILIMVWGGAMPALGFFAFPIAVGSVTCAICFLERTTWLSMVPASFIGAGAFFGFMTYVPGATFGAAAATELIYCVAGLIFGYVAVKLRVAYEGAVSEGEAEQK
ncbi:MAG: DUF1097 domain-containing protein [Rikenellaceae bacterium]